MAVGILHADHVAPFIRKSWQLLRRQGAVARSVYFARGLRPWSLFVLFHRFKKPQTVSWSSIPGRCKGHGATQTGAWWLRPGGANIHSVSSRSAVLQDATLFKRCTEFASITSLSHAFTCDVCLFQGHDDLRMILYRVEDNYWRTGIINYMSIQYIYIYIYIYICNPQSQLFLFVRYLATCFGPYGPSSGENVLTSIFCFVKDHHTTLNASIITYVTFYCYSIYILISLQYLLC
jgi:hypothetical protein